MTPSSPPFPQCNDSSFLPFLFASFCSPPLHPSSPMLNSCFFFPLPKTRRIHAIFVSPPPPFPCGHVLTNNTAAYLCHLYLLFILVRSHPRLSSLSVFFFFSFSSPVINLWCGPCVTKKVLINQYLSKWANILLGAFPESLSWIYISFSDMAKTIIKAIGDNWTATATAFSAKERSPVW